MSDLVGNPEDRFSCVAAQLVEYKTTVRETVDCIRPIRTHSGRKQDCSARDSGLYSPYTYS